MDDLERLLRPPEPMAEATPEMTWDAIVAGTRLHDAIIRRLRDGSSHGWSGIHEASHLWEEEFQPSAAPAAGDIARRRLQLEQVRRLLWCAEQVATDPERYRHPSSDGVDFFEETSLSTLPDYICADTAWAWVCLRSFLIHAPAAGGAPGPSLRSTVTVPVALHDAARDTGIIADLTLELLAPGLGRVALHPAASLAVSIDPSFVTAVATAWDAAKKLFYQETGQQDEAFDARWLLSAPDRTLTFLTGASVGGAAALGWHHALRGALPDPELIVIATVDAEGALHSVGGNDRAVPKKTEAIITAGVFDTIVVADVGNERAAQAVIKAMGVAERVRVFNLARKRGALPAED